MFLKAPLYKGFKAFEQIWTVGWATLWLVTVAVQTVEIASDELMHKSNLNFGI